MTYITCPPQRRSRLYIPPPDHLPQSFALKMSTSDEEKEQRQEWAATQALQDSPALDLGTIRSAVHAGAITRKYTSPSVGGKTSEDFKYFAGQLLEQVNNTRATFSSCTETLRAAHWGKTPSGQEFTVEDLDTLQSQQEEVDKLWSQLGCVRDFYHHVKSSNTNPPVSNPKGKHVFGYSRYVTGPPGSVPTSSAQVSEGNKSAGGPSEAASVPK